MTALREQSAAILNRALLAEIGIIVRTDNAMRAKAVLYRFRKELGDPNLMKLQLRLSPDAPDTDIWVFRGEAEPSEAEPNSSSDGIPL